MENLHQHIESLIFSSEVAVSVAEIAACVNKLTGEIVDEQIIEQILSDIREKFKPDFFSFELRVIGGGYQFFTKPAYHKTVSLLIGQKEKKKLSTAALETLSIIAYKGPVTKTECEQIRGVNCDYSVHKLLEKELIEMAGRMEDAVGKPILYKVTPLFLDYFGINSVNELPKLKDIVASDENTIGSAPDTEIAPAPEDKPPFNHQAEIQEEQ
jgi:segregation and condensation protein B